MLKRVLIALLSLTSATVATAYDPIVLKRGWYRADRTSDGACLGEVGTNGQFYVLTVAGLIPGEEARLVITNGDMKPIDRMVRADGAGRWQEYYIPFRSNNGEGAVVSADITSESCALPLQFTWQRKRA